MDRLIIGSVAIKHHFVDFRRNPTDIDYAVSEDGVKGGGFEGKLRVEYLYNPVILKHKHPNQIYATPEQILTLKMSHITWDIFFKKHMYDIQFLLNEGVKWDKKLYEELYDFWVEYKGVRKGKETRSNLNLNAKDFFNNSLNEFDHDYLHTLLKEVPTYTKILKDGCEVEPCEKKFLNLSHEEKISVVEEEVMVMSYERFRGDYYKVGYNKMLQKFITGHAPIWQVPFIVENFMTLMNPSFNHYKLLNQKLNKKCQN